MINARAQDTEDPDFEDEGPGNSGFALGTSGSLASQVVAKYQSAGRPPMISRSLAQGAPTSPASPSMALAHPPTSQQPKDPVSPMEAQQPSDSTGSSAGSSDARAISDQVYDIMKRELKTSKERK
jgi:hypothetical protein